MGRRRDWVGLREQAATGQEGSEVAAVPDMPDGVRGEGRARGRAAHRLRRDAGCLAYICSMTGVVSRGPVCPRGPCLSNFVYLQLVRVYRCESHSMTQMIKVKHPCRFLKIQGSTLTLQALHQHPFVLQAFQALQEEEDAPRREKRLAEVGGCLL